MNNSKRRFLFQNGGYYHIYYKDKNASTYEPTHSHEFWHCLFVTRGRITHEQGGTQYYQVEREVLFTPPGADHSLFAFAGETIYYCLAFSEELLEDALRAYPHIEKDLSNIRINFELSREAAGLFDNICAVLRMLPESTIPYARDQGYHLACAAISAALKEAPVASKQWIEQRAENPMNAVLRYFENYYYENLNIEEIAERFGFKCSTFCYRFRDRTGISPKRYLTEKRIHEAICLIEEGGLPLNQVAERVGYTDFSTFYRNFIRIMRVSPSEYQEKVRK